MTKKLKLANKWKPIESAPKDSSYILLSAGNQCFSPAATSVVIAQWNGKYWRPMYTEGEYCGAKYWQKLPVAI